jgi:hypothetical protein
MRPRVIRLLGALAPRTEEGTIVGAANALAAEVLRKFLLFIKSSLSKRFFYSRKNYEFPINLSENSIFLGKNNFSKITFF